MDTLFDNFDDRFLGTKTSNPSKDNDNNTLSVGAVYYNSSAGEVRFWNGSSWEAPAAAAASSATNAATSATNAATSASNASSSANAAAQSLASAEALNYSDGVDGTNGVDGTSPTFSFSNGTLTITNA